MPKTKLKKKKNKKPCCTLLKKINEETGKPTTTFLRNFMTEAEALLLANVFNGEKISYTVEGLSGVNGWRFVVEQEGEKEKLIIAGVEQGVRYLKLTSE